MSDFPVAGKIHKMLKGFYGSFDSALILWLIQLIPGFFSAF
jgi:hypothetical protein